ncbi:MAG: hypothetical protein HW413_207 [Thermoleophilia bacterium]|nr:hypothetical protein [Thermoleophilia bacterium]
MAYMGTFRDLNGAVRQLWPAQLLALLVLGVILGFGASSSQAQAPQPTVNAGIENDQVMLNTWTPGSEVTVTIGDIGGVTRTVTIGADGNAMLNSQMHGQDVVPGMTITARDTTITKTLVVADLQITSINPEANTVTGIAPAGTVVQVGINQPDGAPPVQTNTTADSSGIWSLDLTGSVDITLGVQVSAVVSDTEGDSTLAFKVLPRPVIEMSVPGNWIWLGGWTPESTVTLSIGSASLSVPITGFWGDPTAAWIDGWEHGQDLVPGMTITASEGPTTKTLLVVDVQITAVDTAAKTVTGIAPPGANMQVYVTGQGMFSLVNTTANGAGNWQVVFPGVDLASGENIFAAVIDEDGDRTHAERPPVLRPYLAAAIDSNQIWLYGWAPGSTVTLDIDGFTLGVTVGGSGNGWCGNETHGQDIELGTTITATQGTMTKTLEVFDLQITGVDTLSDTVTGIARPGGLTVVVNGPGGTDGVAAVADESGSWTASFAGRVDITAGMSVMAEQEDDDADMTRAEMLITPSSEVTALIALVDSYNLGKLGTSLNDKLVTAQRMLAANKTKQACESLDSFLRQVKAQKGKGLTVKQADDLTAGAQAIKSVIDC